MGAYTRRNLGGKLFVIEWLLTVSAGVGESGDFYENEGARLLSVTGFSDSGINTVLKFSNLASEDLNMNISGQVTVPVSPGFEPPYTPVPVLPPPMAKYGAQAEAGSSNSGNARVGLLFEQL